mgnify:FL=1|jgi:uncharacterized protein (DUF1919 family)
MKNIVLNDENFLLYCAHHYDNSKYTSTEEFNHDLSRIKYIKKLITRYIVNDELKERLILNHIIILNNCFGPEVLCKLLWLKLEKQIEYVKPFLVLLGVLPRYIYHVGDKDYIDTDLILMDQHIVERLREL